MEKENNCFKKSPLGITIMIGLIALGLFIRNGLVASRTDSYVSVKGLCEKEVYADKVIYPIKYIVLGNDIQDLYKQTSEKTAILVSYLRENGISEDEITVSAPIVTDTRTEYGERKPYNFSVKTIVTVCTPKVDIVRSLVSRQGELMSKGIVTVSNEWENTVQYSFNGLNKIKPEMIAEATANARVAAEQFAKDSDSILGKIRRATQGQFSISDRDENTPYIKIVRVVTSVDFTLKN
ncbi:MAG: SIMPL domain-containing protein [Alistipes sp.]|nr:SIMPL domain-containing protein [Candidatus Minthomonas equi]